MRRLHTLSHDELNALPLAPLDCVYPNAAVPPEAVRIYADVNQDLWIALEWRGQLVRLFGLEAEQAHPAWHYN